MNRFREQLTDLDLRDQRRNLLTLEPLDGGRIRLADGRELVNLCGNDYLGLARDRRVCAAAIEALRRYGAGSQASRLVTGNLPIHELAEQSLAQLVGTPATTLAGSGWHANTGLLPVLAEVGDLIFSDERNHASLIDGCRLSKASVVVYRHADITDLAVKLAEHRNKSKYALIVTESVFSMDGDCAPLSDIAELADRYHCELVVDEAHAIGVWGSGRGLVHDAGLSESTTALTVTGGKALGCFGAAVCGSVDLHEVLINRQRSLIFSTSLAPADSAALAESARIIHQEGSILLDKLWSNVTVLTNPLKEAGYNLPEPCGPIVPVFLGDNRRALQAAAELELKGFLARAIRPPSVAQGQARLRLTVSAVHDPEDLKLAAKTVIEVCR